MATTPQNSRKTAMPAGFIDAFADAADDLRITPIVLQPKGRAGAAPQPAKKAAHQK